MTRGRGRAWERCSAASWRAFSDRASAVRFCFTAAVATSSISSVICFTSVSASAAARMARRWSCHKCEHYVWNHPPAISRRRFSWFPFIACTPLLLATHNVIPIPHTSTLKVDVVVVVGVGRFLIQPTLKTTTTSHRTSDSRTHIVI